jgi:outer membrane protein TolC
MPPAKLKFVRRPQRSSVAHWHFVLPLMGLAVLSSCAWYRPLPLENKEPTALASVTVRADTLLPGGVAVHRFDASDGLDATEVAMLAISQSPDLKVLRAASKVAKAQSYLAGLLPDPVVGLSEDRPNSGQPGASIAATRSVAWDVGNLVTLAPRLTARRRADEQVDLALLWAEWQTITESRLDFERIRRGRERVARLVVEQTLVAPLEKGLRAASSARSIPADVAASGLATISDVTRQLAEARSDLNANEHDLRVLLGLATTEPLDLVGEVGVVSATDGELARAVSLLPERRPDLRALAAGYAAEEARVRAAILGQFPAVNFGVNRSSDNTGINSSGFSLSVSLPLFDGNRGNIRLERATRAQLHEEYAQRLLAARADIARLREAERLLAEREARLAPIAGELERHSAAAAKAYEAGTYDWATLLQLRQSALATELDLINLRQTLSETRIGLTALLAVNGFDSGPVL